MHPSMVGPAPIGPAAYRSHSSSALSAAVVSFSGVVIQGRGMSGPLLGHPTFNLAPRQPIVLAHGTYVATARFGGLVAPATLYWGRRPTLETNGDISCELHLLEGPTATFTKAYELDVRVLLLLRPDERFASVAAVRRQLQRDRVEALHRFRQASKAPRALATHACGAI